MSEIFDFFSPAKEAGFSEQKSQEIDHAIKKNCDLQIISTSKVIHEFKKGFQDKIMKLIEIFPELYFKARKEDGSLIDRTKFPAFFYYYNDLPLREIEQNEDYLDTFQRLIEGPQNFEKNLSEFSDIPLAKFNFTFEGIEEFIAADPELVSNSTKSKVLSLISSSVVPEDTFTFSNMAELFDYRKMLIELLTLEIHRENYFASHSVFGLAHLKIIENSDQNPSLGKIIIGNEGREAYFQSKIDNMLNVQKLRTKSKITELLQGLESSPNNLT